jgi:hypothetical protein
MNRTSGVLGLALVAASVFRVVSPTQTPPRPASPPVPPPVPPSSQTACEVSAADEGPWKVINRIFKPQSTAAPIAEPCWECVPKQSTGFLFATLADPEETHLSLNFDRALESLMWAIEDDGYAFEAYWLPWTLTSEKNFAAFADQQCVKKQKEQRRKQPGVLVFRHKVAPEHFLFVWLVGETPTSGVDQTMLSKAAAYSRAINPELLHFRLLGPNFSGSLAPLATQIQTFTLQYPGAYFHIVSGAATNFEAIRQFSDSIKNIKRNQGTFESSIENDQLATTLFFNYLRTQFNCPLIAPFGFDETAVLSEDETVYGDLGPAPKLIPPNDRHQWMMLRYPREIARLRDSYRENSAPAPSSPRQPADEGIPFTLRDSLTNPADSPPDSIAEFSGQQSPASQEAVLQSISATLHRERASYTGIVATDILDSLFLAHFLRTAFPDTRLFTIDADLLFVRETESEPLFGMLAITNYPLFSRNQHWTEAQFKPDHMPRRVQFASRYAEGIYNACRRLLLPHREAAATVTSPDPDGEGGQPEAFLEYERPSDPSRVAPPLWLTVVGRDGYWPVALLDEAPGIKADQSTITDFKTSVDPALRPSPGTEQFHPEEPSRAWRLLFACACLFCFAHVFYMHNLLTWDPNSKSSLARRVQALHHLFSVYPDDHQPTDEERPFLLTATLSLFSSLLLFSFPLIPFLAYHRYLAYFTVAAICLICLLLIAVALMKGRIVYHRVVILSWLLSVPFLGGWMYLILRPDYKSGEFFAYRALYLGNGVSPGIPIVLLAVAFYGWAWTHLHREAEVRVRRQVRPDSEKQPWSIDIWTLIRSTDDSIENILSSKIWIPALGFLCLWFLVLFPPESLRTFEFYLYDFLYWATLTAVYWCIALVTVQFVRVWRQFRKLLEALERHPIRHAFSRLDKEISWIPLVSASPGRSLVVSTRSLDCVKALYTLTLDIGRHDPSLESVLSGSGSSLTASFDTMLHNISGGKDYNAEYRLFQSQLDALTRHSLSILAPAWDRGHSESVTNELQRRNQFDSLGDREKVTMLHEEFLALRLLIYMRYVLRQLRNWLGFIAAAFIISVISMNAYPFQAHRWIGLASLITLLAIGASIAMVFAEMDRDAILSRITATKVNEVGPTFFFRLARFGALPILTVLATQFPVINRVLFFWIRPAFDALK